MASLSFPNGLSIQSQALSSSPLLQGGDLVNLTVNISFNFQETFTQNSTACRRLPEKHQHVQGVLVLPLFLQIISSINSFKEITSDISNCSFTPILDTLVINDGKRSSSFFNISSSNVSWSSQFIFTINVTSNISPASLVNITAMLLIGNEYKNLTLARFKSVSINDFFVTSKGTSLPETPFNELTIYETVNYEIIVNIPSVTTDVLTLTILLPVLGGHTPMEWSHAIVTSIGTGVTTERLLIGSSGQRFVGQTYRSSFPAITNVAKFHFGRTMNSKPYQNSSISISINVEGRVLPSQPYIPGSEGNITFELAYMTLDGMRHVEPIYKSLNLSQPPLSCVLEKVGGQQYYQGNDIIEYKFRIENPQFSTEIAENIYVAIVVEEDVVIQHFSANLCSGFQCTPLHQSNSSLTNITVSR